MHLFRISQHYLARQNYYLNCLDNDCVILLLGNEMYLKPIRPDYDEKEYKPRLERGWAVVILKGTTNLFKGQHVNKNWVKIKDSNDDQEQWLLL